MKRFLCIGLCLIPFVTGCTQYYIHIKTIPPGEYGIYLNKKPLGKTPPLGDTVVNSRKLSVLSPAIIEVKNDTSYGRIGMDYDATATQMVNVCSVESHVHGYLQKYDVTFLFDIRHTPYTLCEKDFDPKNEDRVFIVKPPQDGSVYYCVPNLKLTQGDVIKMANENDDHRLLSDCIDSGSVKKKYPWVRGDDEFNLRMMEGLAGKVAGVMDSLPSNARDLADSLKMKYVVAFYGYSIVQHKGEITPADVAGATGISAVGLALAATAHVGFIVLPSANRCESLLNVYCSIFSVNPNKCMYTT